MHPHTANIYAKNVYIYRDDCTIAILYVVDGYYT